MSHRSIRSSGKSSFLKFLLAWLLSDGQVVLLCNNDQSYLFYRDKVYNRKTSLGFLHLPVHIMAPNRTIWTVIDVDYLNGGPPIRSDPIAWPIQASSPVPIRWKSWHKQLKAALWGMPLWSLEELIEGYALSSFYHPSQGPSLTVLYPSSLSLSPEYNTLRGILEKHLPLVDGLTAPKTGDPQVDAILEVLHLDRVREKAVAEAVAAVAADDGVGAPAKDEDEDMPDQADQSITTAHEVKQAIRILVRNATEEFGFIPRDVYDSIMDLPDMRSQHAQALSRLDYSSLKALIDTFSRDKELDKTSHRVVVVFPVENIRRNDLWGIDFKSIRIAEDAVVTMWRKERQHLREMYDGVRALPDGSVMAGRIFEEIVHRLFCEGSKLPYGPMISNGAEPPTFFTSTDPPTLHLPPFSDGLVELRVDFKSKLSNVTLDSGRYYIPTTTNHPLFDSFTIDTDSRPVIISVFQMTISSKHEGSAKGYFHIRQLKTHVRKLLKDGRRSAPDIKARYFLVCPDDGIERRWEMPAGWWDGERNTHRGDVFCLRVPSPRLPVRRICSLLSSPN